MMRGQGDVALSEKACSGESLPCDVLPFATRTSEFLDRIGKDVVTLP